MGREVRTTIDDDEVFERMKHRKRELDLSWEDVLHRGLRTESGDPAAAEERRRRESTTGSEFGWNPEFSPGPGQFGPGEAERQRTRSGRPGQHDEYEDQWDVFADSVEARVQNKVYNALRNTFGAAGIEVPEPPVGPDLDREMRDLSNAEDAVLSFEFLDDDPAYQIPLRVNLETSVEGLDVEVVAVRQGKSVRDMNQFDSDARFSVTKRLAKGEPSILRFDDGAEGYEVEPVIRWERDESGRPTVTAVDIEAVRLGEDDVE